MKCLTFYCLPKKSCRYDRNYVADRLEILLMYEKKLFLTTGKNKCETTHAGHVGKYLPVYSTLVLGVLFAVFPHSSSPLRLLNMYEALDVWRSPQGLITALGSGDIICPQRCLDDCLILSFPHFQTLCD